MQNSRLFPGFKNQKKFQAFQEFQRAVGTLVLPFNYKNQEGLKKTKCSPDRVIRKDQRSSGPGLGSNMARTRTEMGSNMDWVA